MTTTSNLRAYRADGAEVHQGDTVTSERSGESMRYQYATAPTAPGKAGKIMVNPLAYDQDGGTEVYASHFGLTVAEAPAPDTMIARDVKQGWHMAGVGTIQTIVKTGNELLFSGPGGERVFGAYSLVEATRPAPVMWAADWPYPEFTAAEFAAHYQLAAEIITARGYNAEEMRGYDGTPGVSVCTALKLAALERAQAAAPQDEARQIEITAANVAEELETRLSAVIYTLGLLHSRTGIRDFSDQLAAWELGHYTTGPNPVRSDALGLLAMAASIYTHISDTQAEVTAPEAPAQF